jgi:hypothetical protein
MGFVAFMGEVAGAIDAPRPWIVMLAASALIVAWGGARQPQTALLFLFSIVSAMLTVRLLNYVIGAVGPSPKVLVNIIAVRTLPEAALLLFACAIVTGWSLLTRAPMQRMPVVVTAMVIAYATVWMTYLAALTRETYESLP